MRKIVAFLLVLICLLTTTYAFAASDSSQSNEKIIYDENGIIVSLLAMGYNDVYKVYTVNINVKNNRSQAINYSTQFINVNGYTISSGTYGSIYAGMEADAEFYLSEEELKIANIKELKQMKFEIEISEDPSYDQICTIPVSLKAAKESDYEQTYEFDGEEIYNDKGIRILARLEKHVSSHFILYIDNNTDKMIKIWYDDIAINNKMTDIFNFGSFALPNTVRVEKMGLYSDSIENIDEIESIGFNLNIVSYREDGSVLTKSIIKTGLLKIEAK